MPVRVEPGAEPILGYRLIERLGGGGFGEVWKAEAPGGLMKAIKIVYGDLTTTDADGSRRAEQELKALKRVQSVRHPYLLSLERYDIIEGRLLIVMELADRNLWDRFRECRSQNLQGIPREELLRYMEESAEVLDLMNTEHGLQHLDIKPQNLFLIHQHAKVADFGLVKDLQGMMATVTGGITPVYAAPETFDGVVSRFCDQYSLAIVYQELLTGQRPFAGNSLQQLIMQHLTAAPNLSPLPKNDRGVIGKGLNKKPEDRYPNCMDMVKALRSATTAAAEPAPAKPVAAAAPAKTVARPRAPEPPPRQAHPSRAPATPPAHEIPPARAETPYGLVDSPPLPSARPPRAEKVEELRPVEETGPPVQDLAPGRLAPPQMTGPGVLQPTLVIGLGQKGYEVIRHVRDSLVQRFGALQMLPHLRLIYIDTDPDALQAALQNDGFTSNEVVPTRLNRPSHYLRPSGRSPLDKWFNAKLLYRIPRNPTTTGLRPLGRLALVDNWRTVAAKLRGDIEQCTKPDVLAAANRNTRLGPRTNWPRVHIVTGLAGGTGSGMFIDLAFTARHLLRQLGYADPDVVGHFFLPRADKQGANPMGLANAYASLTELHHFSSPGVVFSFRFDEREGKIKDRDAPFSRINLQQLEPEGDERRAGEATRLLADFLFRDLASPLGRLADESRGQLEVPRGSGQSIGLYRVTWPRRALLHQAARTLCYQVAKGWMAKEGGAGQRDAVKSFLGKEVADQELDAEHLIGALQEACAKALEQSPERVFAEMVEPFIPKGKRPVDPDPDDVYHVVQQMEQLVGSPDDPGVSRKPSIVADALDRAGDRLVKVCGAKLRKLSIALIEEPGFRLAGAEEAIRQLSGFIEQLLEHHEALGHELTARSAEAYEQIHKLLEVLAANPEGGRRTAGAVADLLEVLRLFPKWRYQSLVLHRMASIYITLKGQLSDTMREANFCRQRLAELLRTFEHGDRSEAGAAAPARGLSLMPPGCDDLEEAAQNVLDGIKADDLKDLDGRMQAMIRQQFQSLLEVCLASANQVKALETQMVLQAEAFAAARVGGGNVLEMLLARYGKEGETDRVLTTAFEESAPDFEPAAGPEVQIMALPASPQLDDFKKLVEKALPTAKFAFTESPDDIIVFREQPNVSLAKLEVLGLVGEDAYRQLLNSEHLTPHSRIDISEWGQVVPD